MKTFSLILRLLAIAGLSCSPTGTIIISLDSQEPLDLNQSSDLTLTIYGYDRTYADTTATVLFRQIYPISRLPTNIEIPYSADWVRKITPSSGETNNFGFYIALGSNSVIPGQLVLDYDTVDFDKSFKDSLEALSETLYIKRE
jgi:hypothetical protein